MASPGLAWRCSACGTPNGECACGCGGGQRGRKYVCSRCDTEAFGAYCYTCKAPRESTFEGLAAARQEISGRYEGAAEFIPPVALACPSCQNMMTSMGNGIWRCLNCGYVIT